MSFDWYFSLRATLLAEDTIEIDMVDKLSYVERRAIVRSKRVVPQVVRQRRSGRSGMKRQDLTQRKDPQDAEIAKIGSQGSGSGRSIRNRNCRR